MKNRKAQISMNTIVYVAIAIFILVIIIMFATGAFQGLFRQLRGKSDIELAQDSCRVTCQTASGNVQTYGIGEWEMSGYCSKEYPIDVDNDKSTPDEYIRCWEDPINRPCSETVRTQAGKLMLCSTPLDKGDVTFEACECLEITE